MVGPRVKYLTIIVLFRQNISLHLVVSKFTSVDFGYKILFQLRHGEIIVHMFEQIFAANADFGVNNVG